MKFLFCRRILDISGQELLKTTITNNNNNNDKLLKYEYSFTCEQRHRSHFTAITGLLRTKLMPEIHTSVDHPSIKSIRSITSTTGITRRVVSIDFNRLIDTIDNVCVIDIDSCRFIESIVIDCPGRDSS